MTAFRRTQLIRFAVWVGLATVAVVAAIVSARSDTGLRRIATLLSNEQPGAPRGAREPAKEPQFATRQSDQEAEQRRMNDAIRALSADRDRLLARLSTLERSMDDVTGSTGSARTVPPVPSPAPPAAAPAAAPAVAQPATPMSQGRVAAGHLATGMPAPNAPAATESVATKTEFGIDLGGNATVEGVKAMWAGIKSGQPGLLEGLRPLVSIREVRPGVIELRLIAGPLANASVAARLCAALSAAGQTCQPAVFNGQRLALQ